MRGRTAAVLAAAALSLCLVAPGTAAVAGQEGSGAEERSPGALAREGARRIIEAVETLIDMIPQYGTPYVEDDGDIVIPRLDKHRREAPPEDGGGAAPGVTETQT